MTPDRAVAKPSTSAVTPGGKRKLAVTKFIGSRLFNVTPRDPTTFVAAVAILILTALVAGFLPARRAARIDAMAALRSE